MKHILAFPRSILLFLCILALGTILRFAHISSLPNGLQRDETSIGYNAYAVLQAGIDEHGVSYPKIFKAFGEYKLPGYVYASIPAIKVFGLTPLGVRFVSAFSGTLTILYVYLLSRRLFAQSPHAQTLALISTLFVATNPWHILFSRGAFEVTLALFFTIAGLYHWISAHENQRARTFLLLLSVVFFIGSIYTYNICRVSTPLLLGFLLIRSFQERTRYSLFTLGVLVGISSILLFPFAQIALTKSGVGSTTGTLLFTSPVVQSRLLELRSYAIPFPILHKIVFNQRILSVWEYFHHMLTYFSIDYLFLKGSDHGNHGVGTSGQFFIFQLPLLIIGLVVTYRSYRSTFWLLMFWSVSVIATAGITREAPQATRSFALLIPIVITMAVGAHWLIGYLQNIQRITRILLLSLACVFITFEIVYFTFSYTVRFPKVYARAWQQQDEELTTFITQQLPYYKNIVIDPEVSYPYTSYLFYTKFDPQILQQHISRLPDDAEGFSPVARIGKIEFRSVNWKEEITHRETLFITSEGKATDTQVQIVKKFRLPLRPSITSRAGEIYSITVEPLQYVAVKII